MAQRPQWPVASGRACPVLLQLAVPVEVLVCRVYVLQLAQLLAAAGMCDMCTEGATVGPTLTKHGPWATHTTQHRVNKQHTHTHTHCGCCVCVCVHKFLILKWFAFAVCHSVNESPALDTYLVGGALAEDVAHMGAGHNFESAAAHPGLEGQLQILTAPDIKARVVGAQPFEELAVYREQSSGHGWRVDGLRCALQINEQRNEKRNKHFSINNLLTKTNEQISKKSVGPVHI